MNGPTHDDLLRVVVRLPGDWAPWGRRDRHNRDADGRERFGNDCSMGCRWYAPLDGDLGGDWGVCANPASRRAGLLTFEHQGCDEFEYDEERDWGDE